MTGSYKQEHIRNALIASKGNASLARSALLKQLQTDDRLLRLLAAPFIEGIVSHAIEQQAKADGIALVRQSAHAKPAAEPKKLTSEQLDALVATMQNQSAPPAAQNASSLDGLLSKPDPTRHADVLRSIAKPLKTLGSDYFDRSSK